MQTDFSRHAFQFSVPCVSNSLPQTVLISDSLSVFKSRLQRVFSVQSGFYRTLIQHAASASEVTTVQRSRNSIIIIIISICVSHVNQPKHIYTMPQDIAEAKPMPLPGARLHSQCT